MENVFVYWILMLGPASSTHEYIDLDIKYIDVDSKCIYVDIKCIPPELWGGGGGGGGGGVFGK
jgi:hypothetical protein